jgi:hypothetical protein
MQSKGLLLPMFGLREPDGRKEATMSDSFGVGTGEATLEEVRGALRQNTFNAVRKVLPDSAILTACTLAGYEYRQRLLTPPVVVLHMLLAAIWPEDSFAASWQLLWENMVSRLPSACGHDPGSGSVAKARNRVPLAVWAGLYAYVVQQAQALGVALNQSRGHRLVLLDGTCVSMSAEEGLFATFGTNTTGGKKGHYPLARLVTLALANTKIMLTYALGNYLDSEPALARILLPKLQRGDLLIADRCFAAAYLYALYLSHGLQFLTRMHQRLNPRALRCLCNYTPDDFVAEQALGKPHRKQYPLLPGVVQVRFIRTLVPTRKGLEEVWLATSLLSADDYPAAEIVALYARRWRIEELFSNFKINLSADVLRSKTPEGIRKEVAARLTALNVVRLIMLEAAIQERVDPLRISFVQAMRSILAFSPALASAPIFSLPALYRTMLRQIGNHLVPARPGRQEPRMIRREKKHYPSLKMTRTEWRAANGIAA